MPAKVACLGVQYAIRYDIGKDLSRISPELRTIWIRKCGGRGGGVLSQATMLLKRECFNIPLNTCMHCIHV